jgi:hypothetical protein
MDCSYGKCLLASRNLPVGTIVQKYEGRQVTRPEIPEEEINHALLIDASNWIIVESDARYINHSCDPNCDINDDLEVFTIKPIAYNEELTISYNIITEESYDYTTWDSEWDPRWTFTCQCGSPNCQGVIDKYVKMNGDPLYSGLDQ